MKVKESCCGGSFSKSPLRVIDPDAVGVPTENSKQTQFHNLSEEKFDHMKLMYMYNQFIPPERRPDYLPPFVSSAVRGRLPSTTTTSEPRSKRPRKPSTCSTPGCAGSGHRNPARWAQGHSTRAGRPLHTS